MNPAIDRATKRDGRTVLALFLLIVFVIAVRLLSPSDIYDNDQPTPIAHIVDVAVNGDWLMQDDPSGKLITKPPMYPWLGAIAVKLTGSTGEWAVKLPMIVAFLVVTLVVFDLGRQWLGTTGGAVAAAFWVANYHTFKLLYTARTDMLLTMWMALALWAAEGQRRRWNENRKSPIFLIALFWLAIAAGLLTKGPVAMIPLLWLGVIVVMRSRWKQMRPIFQLAGLAVALALPLWWLMAVKAAYPDWFEANFAREVTERITGGNGGDRDTSPLAIPVYFLGRFAPWSVLFILGAVAAWKLRREAPAWAIGWTLLILAIFMIPQGKRADYIVPAYVSASVLAAWMVMHATSEPDWHREAVRFFLGGIALAGIAAGIACWWTRRPPRLEIGFHDSGARLYAILIIFCGLVALTVGIFGLIVGHRRQYDRAALAAGFVIAGILGIYQYGYSHAAKSRDGDYVHAIVDFVRAERNNLPIACYQIKSEPVQALLGMNEPMDERTLSKIANGGILVTTVEVWEDIAPRFENRATKLIATPKLPSSKVKLLVVRIERAPSRQGGAANG